MSLNWKVSPGDQANITSIGFRANSLAKQLGMYGRWAYGVVDAQMDVTAVHANSLPLDLAGLLAASDADFGHDVFGIRRYLNRDTGRLTCCFTPRYSAI